MEILFLNLIILFSSFWHFYAKFTGNPVLWIARIYHDYLIFVFCSCLFLLFVRCFSVLFFVMIFRFVFLCWVVFCSVRTVLFHGFVFYFFSELQKFFALFPNYFSDLIIVCIAIFVCLKIFVFSVLLFFYGVVFCTLLFRCCVSVVFCAMLVYLLILFVEVFWIFWQ